MTFEYLSEALYEDLNGLIRRIETVGNDGYSILLECDDWGGQDLRRQFILRFEGVSEARCNIGVCGWIRCDDEHVVLWNHNSPQETVYFSSIPANPGEVVGKVYLAHRELYSGWRDLKDYLLADERTLMSGHGMLFRGPLQVADAYCKSIHGLIEYSRIKAYVPKGGFRAFILDGNFIIAKSVAVSEIEEIEG